MATRFLPDRRRFVIGAAYAGVSLVGVPWARWAKEALAQGQQDASRTRANLPLSVQSGDVQSTSALVWAACDRPAQMVVNFATTEKMERPTEVRGSVAQEDTGGTAKAKLTGLPAGQTIFYSVQFEEAGVRSEPVFGRLRTPQRADESKRRDIKFCWSGDTVGQGWGIDLGRGADLGGLRIYEAIRRLEPDFFLHSGDTIYADNPLHPEVLLPDGRVYKNLVTEEKSKVAETLAEFRGNFRYNLLDLHVRRFVQEVPQIVQWDDHEVHNNWYPRRMLTDPRYGERRCAILAQHARRAFAEFTPTEPGLPRIYRKFSMGPLMDLFVLDLRSYRGDNTSGKQKILSPQAAILGSAQLRWLKEAIRSSSALWQVVACDMPLSLIVWDRVPKGRVVEAVAQGNGPPLGRELEFANLFAHLKRSGKRNLVFLTADVHYPAVHEYHPERASFAEFFPFHEFVTGPLHAGSFGPNALDMTFGPKVVFQKPPAAQNLPPSKDTTFFGQVRLSGKTGVMTVSQHDGEGTMIHSIDLLPT